MSSKEFKNLSSKFSKIIIARKTVFDHTIGQNCHLRWSEFDNKISVLEVIYQPSELKINPKVGLVRPKIIL